MQLYIIDALIERDTGFSDPALNVTAASKRSVRLWIQNSSADQFLKRALNGHIGETNVDLRPSVTVSNHASTAKVARSRYGA